MSIATQQAIKETPKSSDARTRLLHAALRLFGERGFGETSIRDLAHTANVNIAAVNYHFKSKENLRMEALRYGFAPTAALAAQLATLCDEARAEGTTEAAEDALRHYVRLFLKQLLAPEHEHWTMVLREQLTPGPAFEMIMRDYLEPMGRSLAGIVRPLLPNASDATVGLCVRSIIGQCVHLRMSLGIVRHFDKPEARADHAQPPLPKSFIDEASSHIAAFSIQALRGMQAESEKKQGRRRRFAPISRRLKKKVR